MVIPSAVYVVFIILVLIAFIVDYLGHCQDKAINLKSAVIWTFFWVLIAFLFAFYLYKVAGAEAASLFIQGYLLEKMLSVDNLFVMMAIFSWFKIPDIYRHRVLYFGIVGAMVFRLIFVVIGASLLLLSEWVEILFAALVFYTAVIMLRSGSDDDEEIQDYSDHLAYKLVYKYFSVFPKLVGHSFFINKQHALEIAEREKLNFNLKNHFLICTPLFLCLCVIEISDVMFAFDSVPAVIAVSKEPVIIYSAMIFAILGLRSLYFVVESLKDYLVHLEKAVIAILFFIDIKIFFNAASHLFGWNMTISASLSLVIVVALLLIGTIFSIVLNAKNV